MDLLRVSSRLMISSILDDVIERFPSIPESTIRDLSSKDPSRKNKYLSWMVKQFDQGGSVPDIIGSLEFFDKNSSRFKERDINKYDLKTLEDEVKSLGKSKRSEMKDLKLSGSQKIFEDPGYVLIRVDSKEAVVQYGKGTKWCITMEDASYFEEYARDNTVFYYMISKDQNAPSNLQKIAIAVLRDLENEVTGVDLYDAEDNQLNESDVPSSFIDAAKRDAASKPVTKEAEINQLIDRLKKSNNSKELEKYSTHENKHVRGAVAQSFFTKPDVLAHMSKDADEDIRETVAKNRSTPANALAELSKDENTLVLISVATNSSAPADVLAELGKNSNDTVRGCVAMNVKTPKHTVIELLKDPSEHVRSNVIKNHELPRKLLLELSKDASKFIRAATCENKKIPVSVLVRLAKDEQTIVRLAVARNTNTPENVLIELSKDQDERVRKTADKNLSYGNRVRVI